MQSLGLSSAMSRHPMTAPLSYPPRPSQIESDAQTYGLYYRGSECRSVTHFPTPVIMAAPSALSVATADGYPKLSALPIIDISPYLTPGNQDRRLSTSAKLHSACLEYGFFYLDISKYIDPAEPEELTRLARCQYESPTGLLTR